MTPFEDARERIEHVMRGLRDEYPELTFVGILGQTGETEQVFIGYGGQKPSEVCMSFANVIMTLMDLAGIPRKAAAFWFENYICDTNLNVTEMKGITYNTDG